VYGARPLRRYIQREIETRIARALLRGEILDGARVVIDAGDDGLEVRAEHQETDAATEAPPEPVGAAA
jgi:ATP-dependent Clp protease ATP-binding subunit ClpB